MKQSEAQRRADARYRAANREKLRGRARQPKARAKRNARLAAQRKVRTAFFARYKLAAGCIDCGYAAHAVALDFDHLGEKAFTIANHVHRAPADLVAELTKCVVRCANCHRVKTHGAT